MIYGIRMCRIHLQTSRELNATLSRSDDLFEALETKLDHYDLIKEYLAYAVESEGPTYIKLFPWG